MLMVDTCFLIDYQRESRAGTPGCVVAFLRDHAEERLQISTIAWGEFIAGFEGEADPFVRFAKDRLDLLPVGQEVASVYREVYRHLKAAGNLIGANDIWIASHALALDRPLVSRTRGEFARVPGLRLSTY